METAFEALPQRDSKRLRKRRRGSELSEHGSSAPGNRKVLRGGNGKILYDTTECLNLQYEFLDHTADVQLHSWGLSLAEAFAHIALAQWGYMTEPGEIDIDPSCDRVIEASGRDPITLLYTFLDRCLFEFTGDDFLACQLQVLQFVAPTVPHAVPTAEETALESGIATDHNEAEPCYIQVAARGERFVFGRHPQGTEVKAVTFSNMQIVVELSGETDPSCAVPVYSGPYSGVTQVVRDGALLRQYSANETVEDEPAEASGSGAAATQGQSLPVHVLQFSAVGASSANVQVDVSSKAQHVGSNTAAGGETGTVAGSKPKSSPADGTGGSLESFGAIDGHAVSAALGTSTRRGPVDVYVIVDI